MKEQQVIWYPYAKALAFYDEKGRARTIFEGSIAEDKLHRLPRGTEVIISIDIHVAYNI